jgi:hypothetical protein
MAPDNMENIIILYCASKNNEYVKNINKIGCETKYYSYVMLHIVTWMATALLGSRPVNTSRPNTRYATIREAVFTPCCSEPREVEDRAVPSRTAPRSLPRQRHRPRHSSSG